VTYDTSSIIFLSDWCGGFYENQKFLSPALPLSVTGLHVPEDFSESRVSGLQGFKMDRDFIPSALPQLFKKGLILSHTFRRSDRANHRNDPSVEKKYVHPYSQEGEIPHQIEPSNGLGAGGGTETAARDIQPTNKVYDQGAGKNPQEPGCQQGSSLRQDTDQQGGTHHELNPGQDDSHWIDHPSREEVIVIQGQGEAVGIDSLHHPGIQEQGSQEQPEEKRE
jgi:hypothetical protein